MPTIAFASQKGGVGKTATSVQVASSLTRYGRVLFVDADAQGNATQWFGIYPEPGQRTLTDLLVHDDCAAADVIITGVQPRLDLIPSGGASLNLAETHIQQPLGERLIKDNLADAATAYAWIVIDTPPRLNGLPHAAFVASDAVIGVYTDDHQSVNGLAMTLGFVRKLQAAGATHAHILGIVRNEANDRTRLAQTLPEIVAELGAPVLAQIPTRVKISESYVYNLPLARVYPNLDVVADYDDIADAINTHFAPEATDITDATREGSEVAV
jgi:chromosome partitioning protein